jgi:hypothetical protein
VRFMETEALAGLRRAQAALARVGPSSRCTGCGGAAGVGGGAWGWVDATASGSACVCARAGWSRLWPPAGSRAGLLPRPPGPRSRVCPSGGRAASSWPLAKVACCPCAPRLMPPPAAGARRPSGPGAGAQRHRRRQHSAAGGGGEGRGGRGRGGGGLVQRRACAGRAGHTPPGPGELRLLMALACAALPLPPAAGPWRPGPGCLHNLPRGGPACPPAAAHGPRCQPQPYHTTACPGTNEQQQRGGPPSRCRF